MQFRVRFSQTNQKLPVTFGMVNRGFDADFKGFQVITETGEPNYYEGAYSATPKVNAQTLPTAHKMMQEDFVIKAIPFYDVSNTSGGTTIYIGDEI